MGVQNNNQGRPIWETLDYETDYSPTQYVRLRVDPKRRQMVGTPVVYTTRAAEFPVIPKHLSGQKHRYAYTVATHQDFEFRPYGTGPPGAILKIDTWRNPNEPEAVEAFPFCPYEFVGEPVFCPKVVEGAVDQDHDNVEDRGYLMLHVHNGRDLTTDLVILDVEGPGSLARGPVTRIRLPTFIPHGLHGIFEPDAVFDF